MAANHKLTGVLRGRKVTATETHAGMLLVHLDDGSTMTVRTGGPVPKPFPSGSVQGVRQQGTRLSLDFEDGTSVDIPLAEETSSVMVRDRGGAMEYAD